MPSPLLFPSHALGPFATAAVLRACLRSMPPPPPPPLRHEAAPLQSILLALSMSLPPPQTAVLLKSILLFSNTHVHVAVVSDSHRTFDLAINAATHNWPAEACTQFTFSRHRLHYPAGTEFMRHLNRPCSSSRHFFPDYFAGKRYIPTSRPALTPAC